MCTCHEQDFIIDSRTVDLTGCARPSAILGFLQEAATAAALKLHASTPEMWKKYHCIWMVARTWYRLDRPLRWNERFTVRTWHRGAKGASTYRDYDLYRDGRPIGEAVSLWVMADPDTGKLFHMSRLEEFRDTDGGELCKTRALHKLRLPPLPRQEGRSMGYSDTDINGHVNNSRYADFACDALHLERLLPGHFIEEMQIGYVDQCRAGECLQIHTGEADGVLFAQGCGPAGDARFRCALKLGALPGGPAAQPDSLQSERPQSDSLQSERPQPDRPQPDRLAGEGEHI